MTLGRVRSLRPKPSPFGPSGSSTFLPDPNSETAPDYQERNRKFVSKVRGFHVETIGAPLTFDI